MPTSSYVNNRTIQQQSKHIRQLQETVHALEAENHELREILTDLYNACQNDGLWEHIPGDV